MRSVVNVFGNMQYVTRYPADFDEGRKYPVLIFLHGAGTRSRDIGMLLANRFFEVTDKEESFPFVTAAPHCSKNSWFDLFETLQGFVEMVSRQSFTDRRRIYLMGASMGGYAAWQLAMSMPDCFAAMVPICGGGMYWNADRLRDIPIWAFHGEKDETVDVEESRKMVEAVNRKGGHALLTVYPQNGHDAWTDTYRNREVFSWLLEHKRTEAGYGI